MDAINYESQQQCHQLVVHNENEINDESVWMEEYSLGCRFAPSDGELIVEFLKKKVMNEPIASRCKIEEVKVYDYSPQILTESYLPLGEKFWYFFSPRDRKYPKGIRPSRLAGNGYWKATGGDKAVIYNGQTVGSKKTLVFFEGKPSKGEKTNWIMHEYQLKKPGDTTFDELILCRIYKREVKYSRRNQEDVTRNNGDDQYRIQYPVPPSVHEERGENNIGDDSNGLLLLLPPMMNINGFEEDYNNNYGRGENNIFDYSNGLQQQQMMNNIGIEDYYVPAAAAAAAAQESNISNSQGGLFTQLLMEPEPINYNGIYSDQVSTADFAAAAYQVHETTTTTTAQACTDLVPFPTTTYQEENPILLLNPPPVETTTTTTTTMSAASVEQVNYDDDMQNFLRQIFPDRSILNNEPCSR